MSKVTDQLSELFPSGFNGVVICINSASAPARKLAIGLYELGATIVISDRNIANVSILNRVLYERSGSKYRYRYVIFDNVHLEKVDVFVVIDQSTLDTPNAKHKIIVGEPAAAKTTGSDKNLPEGKGEASIGKLVKK